MPDLPSELKHLQNLIDSAKSTDSYVNILRRLLKSAVDDAPPADVIKLAETMLQCGIEVERTKWALRN